MLDPAVTNNIIVAKFYINTRGLLIIKLSQNEERVRTKKPKFQIMTMKLLCIGLLLAVILCKRCLYLTV